MENIWEKKVQKISKKHNLNLSHDGKYLDTIFIVLGIIRNLEMILKYMGTCA